MIHHFVSHQVFRFIRVVNQSTRHDFVCIDLHYHRVILWAPANARGFASRHIPMFSFSVRNREEPVNARKPAAGRQAGLRCKAWAYWSLLPRSKASCQLAPIAFLVWLDQGRSVPHVTGHGLAAAAREESKKESVCLVSDDPHDGCAIN